MRPILVCAALFALATSTRLAGQLVDKNKAPNTANEGISRPLIGGYPSQIGDGAWGADANASRNVIALRSLPRHPPGPAALPAEVHAAAKAGAVTGDGTGNIEVDLPSARAWPTAAPGATAGRAAPRGSAATSPRAPTAATRRTCSAWA